MIEIRTRAKAYMEEAYDVAKKLIDNFETDLELAKANVIKEVEERFAQRKIDLNNMFEAVSETYEVEVEEPVDETMGDTETVEGEFTPNI